MAMTLHQRWTQTDLTDLRRRLEAGEQLEQIAEAIGRPAAEVVAMMGRLRLKFRVE